MEGDDFTRSTSRWSVMRRVIDRMNNWYEKIIRDRETGAVIYQVKEPLTEHRHQAKRARENPR
jgi:hypothetical protein